MEEKKSFLITPHEISQLFGKQKKERNFKYLIMKISREISLMIFIFIFTFGALNWPAVSQYMKYWWNVEYRNQTTLTTGTNLTAPISQVDSHLFIPRISVDAPVIWNIPNDDVVTRLKEGVVQYKDTAYPDEVGNVFIIGHSSDYIWSKGKYKNIFALIGKLRAGDKIFINYKKQTYTYQVYDKKIIKPTDTSVLDPTNEPILTLMTCYPIGSTSKRLIVKARLISPSLTQAQSKTPSTTNLPKTR